MSPDEFERDKSGKTPDEAGLSERMDRLGRSLAEKRAAEKAARRGRKSDATGFAQALRLSTEFVAGILVGGGLGWLIDSVLGTSPFGLIVFLLLGFVAGVLNVLRSAGLVADPRDKGRDG